MSLLHGTGKRYVDFLSSKGWEYSPDVNAEKIATELLCEGHRLAKKLPGLGAPERWLERKTDEDAGPLRRSKTVIASTTFRTRNARAQ
jgi:hypothetical protein